MKFFRKIIIVVTMSCVLGIYFYYFVDITDKPGIFFNKNAQSLRNSTFESTTMNISSSPLVLTKPPPPSQKLPITTSLPMTVLTNHSTTTASMRRTVFFLETANKSRLNCRQSCAVESAAKSNPNMDVTLYHVSSRLNLNDSLVELLSNTRNIRFKPFFLNTFFEDSPLRDWYSEGKWNDSPFKVEHLSDALRLLVLWKFGGIYLDLDVVVMKSLDDLVNCSGLEDVNEMANGVMAFDRRHSFLYECLREFNDTYDKDQWSNNGPAVITRVLMRECVGVRNLMDVSRERCNGVTVFPPDAFYAINFPSWRLFFDSENAANTIQRWKNSYLIHVWNKLSGNENVKIGSGQPYELAARLFCPETHAQCAKFGWF